MFHLVHLVPPFVNTSKTSNCMNQEPGNRNSALKVQSPLTKVSKAVSI